MEIGGELQTRGYKPGGTPWRVAIERPVPGERKLEKIITIQQDAPLAMMTSGTYHHYFDADGKRYSHVIDARSGRPVSHETVSVSVTVLMNDATEADTWSTALLCLGSEAGLEIANRQHIKALFIDQKNGELLEALSDSLENNRELNIE